MALNLRDNNFYTVVENKYCCLIFLTFFIIFSPTGSFFKHRKQVLFFYFIIKTFNFQFKSMKLFFIVMLIWNTNINVPFWYHLQMKSIVIQSFVIYSTKPITNLKWNQKYIYIYNSSVKIGWIRLCKWVIQNQ